MYDIDKAYSIMFGLNNNGIIKGKQISKLKIVNNITLDQLTDMEIEVVNEIVNNIPRIIDGTSSVSEVSDDIINTIAKYPYAIRINKDILTNVLSSNIINFRGKSKTKVTVATNKTLGLIKKAINDVINNIQLKILATSGLIQGRNDDYTAMQNYILNNIIDIYNDPRVLYASTTPTTMDPVNDVVEEFDLEATRRNHMDFTTDIYVNQTTAVGKKGIGISATAQKAFYALTYYATNRYLNDQNLLNPTLITIPQEWRVDKDKDSFLSLGFADAKYNKSTMQNLINWIKFDTINGLSWKNIQSDDIGRVTIYQLTSKNGSYKQYAAIVSEKAEFVYLSDDLNDLINEDHRIYVGRNIGKKSATVTNSAVISSSTDNAKEMKLDLLNMTPEVMPSYLYCISLGMNMRDIAKIFTDPILPWLINKAKGNLFNDQKSNRISTILKSSLKNLSIEYDGTQNNVNKLSILRSIFKGAEELTLLGRTLGINGGIDVELGDPLMYQLNFEKNISDNIKERFSLEQFIKDAMYRAYTIAKLNENKQTYNILDIISETPHYMSMINVPIQFKYIMKAMSKDVDNTYDIIYDNLKFKYKIDKNIIKNIVRVFNERKIFDFLNKNLDFKYHTNVILRIKQNNGKYINSFDEVELNEPREMSIDNIEGLVTLKTYIENAIIPYMKKNYADNYFVNNLIYNTQFNLLFGKRFGSYASRIDTTDSLNNEDQINLIKNDFYKIQDDVIDGHTLYDWMTIYDLLIYKHTINKNSLSLFLDGEISNPNSVMYKYIQYVNDYDNSDFVLGKLKEISSLKSLESILKVNMDGFVVDDYNEYFLFDSKVSPIPSWAIDPEYFPLFVDIDNFNNQSLLSKNYLSKLFATGYLLVTKC